MVLVDSKQGSRNRNELVFACVCVVGRWRSLFWRHERFANRRADQSDRPVCEMYSSLYDVLIDCWLTHMRAEKQKPKLVLVLY